MKLAKSLCLLLCLSASQPVTADESYGDLSARLDDLEKKVGGQSPSGADFATKEDLEALVAQIKELRGRIEVLEHGGINKDRHSAAPSLVSPHGTGLNAEDSPLDSPGADDEGEDDVEAILKDLGTSSASPQETLREKATKKAEKEAPTGTLEKSDESAQYNQALALYKQKEYAEAEEAFRYYLKTFPKGKQANQARLHVAESQLAIATESKQKDAAKGAAADFATAYKAQPKGSIGAQALLGMAKSMKLQGETKKACVVLKKLKADFPKEKTTMTAAQNLSKQYKCG